MEDKQGVLFWNLFRRPVAAVFDSKQSSSDGGSLLLKACDQALGLTETLASWLRDGRQPGKVVHGVRELLRQRVFAIACGYADGNDGSRLRRDPVLKLLAGRDPEQGRDFGFTADRVALRELDPQARPAGSGEGVCSRGDRAAAAAAKGSQADRDRLRSDLRSDARGTAVEPVQPLLRHDLLPAAGGFSDLRQRAGAIPGVCGAEGGQCAGEAGSGGDPEAVGADAAGRPFRRLGCG